MSEKIIEFKNVTMYYYDAETEEFDYNDAALTDVNLTINKGEFVAVLGHNGPKHPKKSNRYADYSAHE